MCEVCIFGDLMILCYEWDIVELCIDIVECFVDVFDVLFEWFVFG